MYIEWVVLMQNNWILLWITGTYN